MPPNVYQTASTNSDQSRNDGTPRLVGTGSGFYINPAGYVVTNAHVIEGCASIYIDEEGKSIELLPIAVDPISDLAVLRSDYHPESWLTLSTGKALRRGDKIVSFGFPLTGYLTDEGVLSVGIVSALQGLGGNSQRLQISSPVQPGNSGGPLLDADASVVGVIVARLNVMAMVEETGSVPQNVNFAIKVQALSSFLDGAEVSYTVDTDITAKTTTEIGEIAAAATPRLHCYK